MLLTQPSAYHFFAFSAKKMYRTMITYLMLNRQQKQRAKYLTPEDHQRFEVAQSTADFSVCIWHSASNKFFSHNILLLRLTRNRHYYKLHSPPLKPRTIAINEVLILNAKSRIAIWFVLTEVFHVQLVVLFATFVIPRLIAVLECRRHFPNYFTLLIAFAS